MNILIILATFIQPIFADYYQNGKLISGNSYSGGIGYEHILVEEAERSISDSSFSSKFGRYG